MRPGNGATHRHAFSQEQCQLVGQRDAKNVRDLVHVGVCETLVKLDIFGSEPPNCLDGPTSAKPTHPAQPQARKSRVCAWLGPLGAA